MLLHRCGHASPAGRGSFPARGTPIENVAAINRSLRRWATETARAGGGAEAKSGGEVRGLALVARHRRRRRLPQRDRYRRRSRVRQHPHRTVARRNGSRRQRNSKRPNHFCFLSPKTHQATPDDTRQQATLFETTGGSRRLDRITGCCGSTGSTSRGGLARRARSFLHAVDPRDPRDPVKKHPKPHSPKYLRIVSPGMPTATEFAATRQYHPPDRIPNPAPNP